MMRSRTYRRNQGPNRRKAIYAVVVSGVLVAAGLAGVQFANASTTPKAAGLVSVDGQQFDVSKCAALEINGGDVVCDGKKLAPQQAQDAGAAALASAAALEASCDQFAADAAAAEQGAADQGAADQGANEQGANEQDAADKGAADAGDKAGAGEKAGAKKSAAAAKAARAKLATKWTKALKAAQ